MWRCVIDRLKKSAAFRWSYFFTSNCCAVHYNMVQTDGPVSRITLQTALGVNPFGDESARDKFCSEGQQGESRANFPEQQ